MITKFIAGLSAYYNIENDLSNITCILCDANEDFKTKFLRFFFSDIDISKVLYIEREVPDPNHKGCRVDIHITLEKDPVPYIIEVKINDKNSHFGQYDKGYKVPPERFGYITNYNCIESKCLGYPVRTWEDFYKHLSKFEDNDQLILDYLDYLKDTCHIRVYNNPMDITGLTAIPCFIDSATKVIEQERDWLKTTLYRRLCIDRYGVNKGFFFKFTNQRERRDGYGLLGLWFQDEPCITICINSREWLSDRIMNMKETIMEGAIYCESPYYEDCWRKDDVFINLKEEMLDKFIHSKSYEEQMSILSAFFDEAMHRISTCFSLK